MNMTETHSKSERLRERAREYIRTGQLEAAQSSLLLLVKYAPQDVPAWLELSRVMAQLGYWKDSSAPLLQATQYLPRHVPLLKALIEQLMQHGEIVATRRCLDFLAQAPEPPAELLKEQAGFRFLLGEYTSARNLLEQALDAGADDPDSHYTYATVLHFMGDNERASRVLERCIERWPRYCDAAVLLANLPRVESQTSLMAHAEKQLRSLEGDRSDAAAEYARASYDYVRFKVLDDLDRREEAWGALARCNQRMSKLYPYDAKPEKAFTDALIRMPLTKVGHAKRFEGPVPIFIVGMPRSGTTLLERMLSAHSQIASAGELIDFQRQLRNLASVPPGAPRGMLKIVESSEQIDFQSLGERYLEQTQWRAGGRAFYVDKLPANIRMVAFIRQALPHAPIVHMVRDPMDTCFSNFKLMFGSGSPYSYDMDAMASFYRQYARLAEHWHADLPGAMLDVNYTDLVNAPELTIQRVLTHCGLEVEDACLHPEHNPAPVATPSSAQVREPIHQRGIGQWHRYAAPLEPLKVALDEFVTGS